MLSRRIIFSGKRYPCEICGELLSTPDHRPAAHWRCIREHIRQTDPAEFRRICANEIATVITDTLIPSPFDGAEEETT